MGTGVITMNLIQELSAQFKKTKSEFAVGLDIGNSSVKVVQLHALTGAKNRELVNFGLGPLKSSGRADIVEAVKKVMEAAHIETKFVNTSVSGQSVIVRYIQMPRMTREELIKALKLGMGKYIPFNLADVTYDFQILDPVAKNEKMMQVLLVAAKKDMINERVTTLKEAGLVTNIIDVDSFATVNSFELLEHKHKGVIAVVDIGADITSLAILFENNPHFSRDISLGGSDFTKVIMKEFDMAKNDAEALKHNPQERYGDVLNAVRPVLDSLVREINLSFNYCESQMGASVQKIYLTGGVAKFKGIDKVLNSIVGVDVEIWDSTRVLHANPSLPKEQLLSAGPLLTVAVGLAIRGR
jgi:type IV pilus assembly protein PilM